MQLDPTRWLVPLAGFVYDWLLTREWTKILLCSIPLCLLTCMVGIVWWGNNQDQSALAAWYSGLGEQEIRDWKEELTRSPPPDNRREQVAPDKEASPTASDREDESRPNEISPYANMLFRRAQLLGPSSLSQFMIAVNLVEQGAVPQGKAILQELAPADRQGYPPAHALLAMVMQDEFNSRRLQVDRESVGELLHHIWIGQEWRKAPLRFLQNGSSIYWDLYLKSNPKNEGLLSKSKQLLLKATQRDPALELVRVERARRLGEMAEASKALEEAEPYLRNQLQQDPKNEVARVRLAQALILKHQLTDAADDQYLQEAAQVLKEGMRIKNESSQLLQRALSDLWLSQSVTRQSDGTFQVDPRMLEAAWGVDPSNPKLVEQIALLARIGGPTPSKEMIELLQENLASGEATVTTHARLAEAYLLKQDYAKALPHLRQVVLQSPRSARFLNNLAYVLAEIHPDQLDEAIEYSRQAVEEGMKAGDPSVDDYFDTRGTLLSLAGRSDEAIAAFEKAIGLNRRFAKSYGDLRLDYLQKVAEEYRKLGNDTQAQKYEQQLEALRLNQQNELEEKEADEAQESESIGDPDSENSSPVNSDPTESGLNTLKATTASCA